MQELDSLARGAQVSEDPDFTSENENTVGSARDFSLENETTVGSMNNLSLPANPESRWGPGDFSMGRVAGEALRKLDEATRQWLDEVVEKLADTQKVGGFILEGFGLGFGVRLRVGC
jgi:hypothetical protein